MNRRRQNIFWLSSLVVLTALSVLVNWLNNDVSSDTDDFMFTLEPNSIITSVELKSKDKNLDFEYKGGEWIVNGNFKMDAGMRDAFFTVISSIRVKRPVGLNVRDSIANFLIQNGVETRISNQGKVLLTYIVGGDELKSISYYMDPEKKIPYIVTLPGYDSFVAGIYKVPEPDWKDRFILKLDWSNIKKIDVNYPGDPQAGFKIEYKEDFFYLNNETVSLDSASAFDYIGELTNLQVERFLPVNSNSQYDSLTQTIPEARFTLSLIGQDDQTLEIYPRIHGARYQFGRLNGIEGVEFNPKALVPVLKKEKDW